MRVLRTILGLLSLVIGLPALLAGAAFWAAMQHRDAGGAFSGDLQHTVTPGYAVVVPDADGLLRRDAPFARAGDTRLRLTAYTSDGPAFIGIGPADMVARYLDDVPQQLVTTVDLGTGALPVATERVGGATAPASVPETQSFWLKSAVGGLDWHPSTLRGRHYSLVIMSPSAQPGLEVTATAGLSPGWLNSATWSLLILGSLLVMAGIVVLAWPGRRREVVYVVEPSQVPDLMVAIGAPLPLSRTGGGRHAGTHRPRTLADAGAKSTPLALPPLAWPPSQSGTVSTSLPQVAGASPAGPSAVPPSPAEYAAATAIPGPARGIGQRMPAPGEPLSLIGGVPSKGVPSSSASSSSSSASPSVSAPSDSAAPAAAANEAPGDRSAERIGRRRAVVQASDTPVFEATAVGAWVAETAAVRARETQARAAAVLAAEAVRRQAAEPAKGGTAEVARSEAAEVANRQATEVKRRPAAGAHTARDETPEREMATAAASGRDGSSTMPTARPAGPVVSDSGSEGWSATGLRRADSPRLSATVAGGMGASRTDAGPEAATETRAKVPNKGDKAPPIATKIAAAGSGPTRSGMERPVTKSALEPAAPARPCEPESTAPAPARPAAPSRPAVPAPARPAPPPRPTPAPTPSRPAAESPAVSQPAAKEGNVVNAPAPLQPAVTTAAAVGPVRTGMSGPSGVPPTHPKAGQSQAPVHVSISDRPGVVSQPGSSIPSGPSEPAAEIVQRPPAETPSTTTEIQARLQAAMKSSSRLPGGPRSTAPSGSPTAVPSSAIAAAPVRPASPTGAVPIGVAGRRDYPASARRDTDAARSGRTGGPAAKTATSGSKPMSGDDTSATTGSNHIAEQRLDSEQATPAPMATEAGGKAKARRAAAKATNADRMKPAKSETAAPSVPGARLSAYAEEAAELLAGLSPDRRRRKQDGATEPVTEARSTGKEPAKD